MTAPKTDPHEKSGPKPGSGYSKHGLTTMKHALKAIGGRVIDMRTQLGKALAQWRSDLIDDLGGPDVVTTQQRAIVDLAVKTKLLLDSIDAWMFTQKSLVNVKRKAVLPVVMQRQQMADGLARYMKDLGLERRAKKAPDLTGYLAKQYGGKGGNGAKALPKAADAPLQPVPAPGAVTNSSDSDSQVAQSAVESTS